MSSNEKEEIKNLSQKLLSSILQSTDCNIKDHITIDMDDGSERFVSFSYILSKFIVVNREN